MIRCFTRLSLFVAVALAFPLLGKTPPRNWDQCPATYAAETPNVVYALGDTHGDYDRLVKLLLAGKLLLIEPPSPELAQWNGGSATLIVTGDLIDKWDRSLEVIALMRALSASAAAKGGRVAISVGNHEAEFLSDPTGSKTEEFQKELTKAGIAPKDVADGTDAAGIGQFLLCLPFASRVNGWFFAHAGSTKGRTFLQLEADLRKGLDADGYSAKVLLGEKGLLEARMKPMPWWEKANENPIDSIARLLGYADALGVKHIVFGHQPGTYELNNGAKRKKGTMFPSFDALVVLIDMGMSRGVDYSHGGLLRIERAGDRETATALFADGTEQQLWSGSTKH